MKCKDCAKLNKHEANSYTLCRGVGDGNDEHRCINFTEPIIKESK